MDGETWVRVASGSDVAEGAAFAVEANGRQLALYRVEGQLYCTDNVCTHAFALLSDGWLDGNVIECPLHAGQFDVCTGRGLGPPIDRDLQTYLVQEDGADIRVALPG